MGFRIKEICKEKSISMGMLADKLGITSVSLSQCLSGNPSLKRLQEIADALGVGLLDLFEKPKSEIHGCVFVGDEAHVVRSKSDLERLCRLVNDLV